MNDQIRVVGPDGRPTVEFLRDRERLVRRLADLEARLAALNAVAAPVGGATVDAEARAAINAIRAV